MQRTFKSVTSIASILTLSLVITSVQAFAHGDDKDPCKTYFKSCKGSKGGKESFHECVKTAATTANDQACLTHLTKEEGLHHHHGKKDADMPAPATGTAPAAPAGN